MARRPVYAIWSCGQKPRSAMKTGVCGRALPWAQSSWVRPSSLASDISCHARSIVSTMLAVMPVQHVQGLSRSQSPAGKLVVAAATELD